MASDTGMEAVSNELLGQRLRDLRVQSGKSLRAVARELGISASAVSQIERGMMRPSVSRLIGYVSAIDVPLAAVFDVPDTASAEPEEPADARAFAIRRSWEVSAIQLSGGVTFRRLSPVPTPDVEFFESTYPPQAVSTAHGQFLKHDGYEVGTVTAGELTIEFESEVVTLAKGDSITFPCSRPHIIGNRSETVTAVATWLIVHH
ncbi:helix-turn-helix domain-containing protein [Nonomuraea sp. NEAU-A123]|uniref:helix-turn-helix domain-containing protein n=1 Tax=Nonomuraea sp. NEAU-A123 TaxID=2839649 RepID=UPI001BE4557D|nr:helix-turn-helix domain-containing protein [Nonomuraea sp. NEAU-A123]MBT2230076.1 helix-turn-helix domain-containing protein [Nonomuraea sp. NEAU-A123]MBT2230654.1 helix-turn-helix domain-containing protein [Nonomuraea sp. NEAU-A123]